MYPNAKKYCIILQQLCFPYLVHAAVSLLLITFLNKISFFSILLNFVWISYYIVCSGFFLCDIFTYKNLFCYIISDDFPIVIFHASYIIPFKLQILKSQFYLMLCFPYVHAHARPATRACTSQFYVHQVVFAQLK